jgi:hypothetical protein
VVLAQAAPKTSSRAAVGNPSANTLFAIADRTLARPAARSRALTAALGLALTVGASLVAGGCSANETLEVDPNGPGHSVVAGIIACKEDTDCKTGEACGKGFCQMKRCSDLTYDSQPPLGKGGYAFLDRAFVTSGDDGSVRAFSSHSPSDGGQGSLGAAPLDIAGGNLTGQRPEPVAYIVAGSQSLTVTTAGAAGAAPKQLALGWQGKRVATGDVDGDGIDEIVVAGEGGEFAVCSAVKGTCAQGSLSGVADDVAVGDVDGDGLGELLFVGNHTLTVVNGTTLATTATQPVQPTLAHLTAGDLDGDGKAEIIGAETGYITDTVHVFRLTEVLAEQTSVEFSYTTVNDLAVTMQDNVPTLGVLSGKKTLQLFTYANQTLTEGSSTAIASKNALRLTASDVNGRSARVQLKTGPTLEVGPPVPIAVLTLPPYSAAHSTGPSSATMGTTEETSTADSHGSSKTTSVSLMLSAGFAVPVLGNSVSAFMSRSYANTVSRSKTANLSRSVGGSYTITAEPQVDGFNSGGVVLAGGCFHRYDYTVEDPAHVLGGASADIKTFVPVGGETSLWSTNRYNALVDALADGRLPKITIPSKLGSVSSYPSKPVTLDGQPIAKADNVFPKPPITRASDVGTVSFSLTSSDSTTNTDATAFSYGESAGGSVSANVHFVQLTAQATKDTNWGVDQSYSVTVGTSASFSGQISPVRDDPSTPANEAAVYGYSFQPLVYRHHFKDAKGKAGAFYVMTYTAGK